MDNRPMTMEEAFDISLRESKPITHRFFTEDEFIEVLPDNKIKTEEGYVVTKENFIKYRKEDCWKSNWYLF